VITGDGRFVEVQGTAEEEPFTMDDLDARRELAAQGCLQRAQIQRDSREI